MRGIQNSSPRNVANSPIFLSRIIISPPGAVHTSAIHQRCAAAKLVLQLFKRAVDGSLDSRGPEVDISVHSNTSGEQECVSAKNVWISIKGS